MTRRDSTIEPLTGSGHTRGWCPGVLDPMETGDGWLLRIRVPGGSITAESLQAVAAIAAEFGSGIVDITSRGNLQIRGVPSARLDRATAATVAAHLARRDARSEAFRSVVSNPLTGHDPDAACDATPIVDTLVARLVHGITGTAPSKFGIVLDDGGRWPLENLDADITLQAFADRTWAVRLRGVADPIGHTEDPVSVAERATQLCVEHGSRMNQIVASLGRAEIVARLGVSSSASYDRAVRRSEQDRRIIGVLPHHDVTYANVVAAPFLGRADATVLTSIAALATAHSAELRLTPDHSVAFCRIRSATSTALHAELATLGLVVDGQDPRASISACVGSSGCSWAHADTSAAAHQRAAGADTVGRVHLSACAKQCGAPAHVHHLIADSTGFFR